MTKKRKIKIGIVALIFIILLCVFFLSLNIKPKKISTITNSIDNPTGLAYEAQDKKVNSNLVENLEIKQEIAFLEINGAKYESEISENISVYEFMEKLKNEGKINFVEKNYIGIGKFIEEINGIKGKDNKYWIYYVNEKKADIGVSDYKLKNKDIVSWKYE